MGKSRNIALVMLVMIVMGLLVGCSSGVSQSDYDTLQAEYDELYADFESVTEAYADLKDEYMEYKEEMAPYEQAQQTVEPEQPRDMREVIYNTLPSILEDCIDPDAAISSVKFEGQTLVVNVDLGRIDQDSTALKDIAARDAGFITDEILDHEDYDAYWEEIRVDFGSVGYALGDKSMVKTSSLGIGRYIDFGDNIIIEK